MGALKRAPLFSVVPRLNASLSGLRDECLLRLALDRWLWLMGEIADIRSLVDLRESSRLRVLSGEMACLSPLGSSRIVLFRSKLACICWR